MKNLVPKSVIGGSVNASCSKSYTMRALSKIDTSKLDVDSVVNLILKKLSEYEDFSSQK